MKIYLPSLPGKPIKDTWHTWFAWHPIFCYDPYCKKTVLVWFSTVWRIQGYDDGDFFYCYSFYPPEYKEKAEEKGEERNE